MPVEGYRERRRREGRKGRERERPRQVVV